MKVLVTSGGTKIPIDRVRNITNMSKGTFGSKIAWEFLKLGHDVVFYKATDSKSPMSLTIDLFNGFNQNKISNWCVERSKYAQNYMEYSYSTFDEYAENLKFIIGLESPDVILLAAAVSDYGVENFIDGKVRSNDMFSIKLKQLPKLIYYVKEWAPNAKLVGFKLLVNSKHGELLDAANRSIKDNGCDMIVANDLQQMKDDNHQIDLVFKNGVTKHFQQKDIKDDLNYLARMVAIESVQL